MYFGLNQPGKSKFLIDTHWNIHSNQRVMCRFSRRSQTRKWRRQHTQVYATHQAANGWRTDGWRRCRRAYWTSHACAMWNIYMCVFACRFFVCSEERKRDDTWSQYGFISYWLSDKIYLSHAHDSRAVLCIQFGHHLCRERESVREREWWWRWWCALVYYTRVMYMFLHDPRKYTRRAKCPGQLVSHLTQLLILYTLCMYTKHQVNRFLTHILTHHAMQLAARKRREIVV